MIHEERQDCEGLLCWTFLIAKLLLIAMLMLPFLIDKALAEPQRLTTEAQRSNVVAKAKAKADNMPDLQAFEDAVDKAFPDNKQAAVIKKLARVLNVQR